MPVQRILLSGYRLAVPVLPRTPRRRRFPSSADRPGSINPLAPLRRQSHRTASPDSVAPSSVHGHPPLSAPAGDSTLISLRSTLTRIIRIQLDLGLLLQRVLRDRLERLLYVDRLLGRGLKVGNVALGLAPGHGSFLRDLCERSVAQGSED